MCSADSLAIRARTTSVQWQPSFYFLVGLFVAQNAQNYLTLTSVAPNIFKLTDLYLRATTQFSSLVAHHNSQNAAK